MSGRGRLDRMAPDIDRSKRASAPGTVIRHREVARSYVGVLARGARINRWIPDRREGRAFKRADHWADRSPILRQLMSGRGRKAHSANPLRRFPVAVQEHVTDVT
jgi:hypothetical protein